MFNATAESGFCAWLFKDVASATCFAAPLVRESKGHFDSLEIPRNVKKKEREENSTRKDTYGTAEVI